jgi:HlyD family secretion protein
MKWRLWLKIGLSGFILAVLAIGGWYGYSYYSAEDAPVMAAQATTTVRKGDLSVKISGTGSIGTTKQQTVTAGTNGVIASVYAEEGAEIHKGDLLFTLEGADVESQIRSKELDLQKANLTYEELQLKYKQAEDDSRSSIAVDLEKQKLTIQSIAEELNELRESQTETKIVASIDGKVGAINVEPGSSVTPATVLTEIVNYNQLQLKVAIDELDISSVEVGQEAEIMAEAFSGDVFSGKVSAIADQGTSSNGVASFDVTITLDDPRSIKAGMSAEASILVQQKSDVLLLPIDAVQSVNNRYFVVVPDSGGAGASGDFPTMGEAPAGGPASNDRLNVDPRSRTADGTVAEGYSSDMRGTRRGTQGAQGMQGTQGTQGINGQQRSASAAGPGSRMVFIETGINNEDYIEIVSGLEEGDIVIVPTVVTGTSNNAQNQFPGGMGAGGFSFPGGLDAGAAGGGPGGSFNRGGFTGGGQASGGQSGGGRP